MSADRPIAPVLEVSDLRVAFPDRDGPLQAVDGISFQLRAGEVLAVVGESGSGKTAAALAIMGLHRPGKAQVKGSVRLRGRELVGASERELQEVRGEEIAMVFQDPSTSLNPVHKVGEQIVEAVRAHRDTTKVEARALAVRMLEAVGIADPERSAVSYPHQLSGGMSQRAMIAMALALEPSVLIADEPTTALDVTIQAQILDLIAGIGRDRELATILITHDLGVVAEVADRVAVMYAGRVVEEGTLEQIFYDPQHPYTWGLLGSLPRLDRPKPRRLPQIPGVPPSPRDLPEGCHFRPRCPHEFDRCPQAPGLEARQAEAPAHRDRCWLPAAEKRERREVDGLIGLQEWAK
jgi:oligopeptide/dipeptide ABC transporter ATP-binding protein